MSTYTVQPLSFFDAQSESFRLNNSLLDWVPAEESDIVRFVRTPEGRGVATIRTNGGGDVWTITEHDAVLRRTGHWCAAEFVVVLDEGTVFRHSANPYKPYAQEGALRHIQRLQVP